MPREVGGSMERLVLGTWRLENMIFLIESVVYSNCTYFSPIDIVLRLRSVKRSASEVDSVQRNTVPTTPAMGPEK